MLLDVRKNAFKERMLNMRYSIHALFTMRSTYV